MTKDNKRNRLDLLSTVVLAIYLILLLWLVLFKFSFDIISVLQDHQSRGFNLIPFTGQLKEMVSNLIVFVPFGLLLGSNFKQITLWQKLAIISIFSVAVEMIQFVLAIGITDITDVAMNTLGGLAGLLLYKIGEKHVDSAKKDYSINIVCILLMALFLVFRFFILRVKY